MQNPVISGLKFIAYEISGSLTSVNVESRSKLLQQTFRAYTSCHHLSMIEIFRLYGPIWRSLGVKNAQTWPKIPRVAIKTLFGEVLRPWNCFSGKYFFSTSNKEGELRKGRLLKKRWGVSALLSTPIFRLTDVNSFYHCL